MHDNAHTKLDTCSQILKYTLFHPYFYFRKFYLFTKIQNIMDVNIANKSTTDEQMMDILLVLDKEKKDNQRSKRRR